MIKYIGNVFFYLGQVRNIIWSRSYQVRLVLFLELVKIKIRGQILDGSFRVEIFLFMDMIVDLVEVKEGYM